MPSITPDLPWEKAASDIRRRELLVLVDYYSKYIKITKLKDLTAHTSIETLKEHFGRLGLPETLITYWNAVCKCRVWNFVQGYDFEYVMVSPKHPRANGEAEAAVKTVKSWWRKNKDKHKALLDDRATPILRLAYLHHSSVWPAG